MCDQCEKREQTNGRSNRRLKLWEIESSLHCAILGTCLTIDELQKVMRQSRVILENRPSDYDLHATMVGQAELKGQASRNLTKMLDRKYRRWIQMLARYKDQGDLQRHWQEAMVSGDIAGTFWALMTHPHTGFDLVRRAYEDVHMLSHLQGASNRADLRRIKSLEKEVTGLQETLSMTRQNHNEQIKRRDELNRRLEQELVGALADAARQGPKTGDTAPGNELSKENPNLVKRLDWAESQLGERDMQIARLQDEIEGLKELLDEAREEHTAMEQTLELLLAENSQSDTDQDWHLDLGGKKVLYVGGRATLAPHLRSLVESRNGRFEHHDGGLEDSRAGLQCTLAGADMVFCPVDCISHDACRRVKRHCQQRSKQFIPLRSSGLSAFAAGLQQISTQALGGSIVAVNNSAAPPAAGGC